MERCRDLNSMLPLPPLYCTYIVRVRVLGISRIIWLMARRGESTARPPDREESERANWSANVCVRVYSSGNGKRSHRRSSTLSRYRAAIELIAKWCVQRRAKCHPWNEIRDGLLEHVPRHRHSALYAALYLLLCDTKLPVLRTFYLFRHLSLSRNIVH